MKIDYIIQTKCGPKQMQRETQNKQVDREAHYRQRYPVDKTDGGLSKTGLRWEEKYKRYDGMSLS